MKLKIYYHSLEKKEKENELIEVYLKRCPWKIEFENYQGKKYQNTIIEEVKGKYYTIALTEGGKEHSSPDFAKYMQGLSANHGSRIAFIIGPAEGFDKAQLLKANATLSLGKMTYPHNLARLLLVEQMYRCWTILENKPYHK